MSIIMHAHQSLVSLNLSHSKLPSKKLLPCLVGEREPVLLLKVTIQDITGWNALRLSCHNCIRRHQDTNTMPLPYLNVQTEEVTVCRNGSQNPSLVSLCRRMCLCNHLHRRGPFNNCKFPCANYNILLIVR